MNRILLVCLACLLLFSCADKNGGAQPNQTLIKQQLQGFINEGEYFKFESSLNLYKGRIPKEQELYYQAVLNNAFNRNEEAIKNIDSALALPATVDSIRTKLNILLSDCYFKTFQYAKNVESDSLLVTHFASFLDSEKMADMKNHLLVSKALRNIPVQQVEKQGNSTIEWTKDKLGLIEIPVKSGAATYSSVFDTRANVSSITRTYAKKLGLKILDVSFEESSGATGIKFKTGLGIADSLYIGDILVRHSVFQVMPDSIFYFPQVNFGINVIIGFPIIEQLKEIQIFKNGTMVIPLVSSKSALRNLALDELDPVVFLKSGNDTLPFHLDLGDAGCELYAAYFKRFQPAVLRDGRKTTIEIGGAGGSQKKEVYRMPSIGLYLGERQITLDSVDVLTMPTYPGQKFYGNLGQDLLSKFTEFVLNFEYMYIEGK